MNGWKQLRPTIPLCRKAVPVSDCWTLTAPRWAAIRNSITICIKWYSCERLHAFNMYGIKLYISIQLKIRRELNGADYYQIEMCYEILSTEFARYIHIPCIWIPFDYKYHQVRYAVGVIDDTANISLTNTCCDKSSNIQLPDMPRLSWYKPPKLATSQTYLMMWCRISHSDLLETVHTGDTDECVLFWNRLT